MKMDSEDSYRSRSDVEDESSSSEYLPEQNQRRRGRGKRAGGGPTAATRNRNKGSGRGGGRRGGRGGVDKQQSAISARQTNLEECISTMETEELRRVLRRVCSKQPSFVLDILDTVEGDGPAQAGTEGRAAPSWCVCNYCRNMPTDRERVCCGESRENCQSRRPDFSTVCLDELVLKVAMRYYIPEPRDDNINKSRRYAAYRQYIMWVHGKLGTGRRKVIPSCCVWRIRDTFPEPSGQYAGYLNGVAKPSH